MPLPRRKQSKKQRSSKNRPKDQEKEQQPVKKPALKDLRSFENSRHLVQVMHDAAVGEPPSLCSERDRHNAHRLVALSARSEHQPPGMSPSPDPDLIKIDARNGAGLLMDYEVSLNMRVELAEVRRGSSDESATARVLTQSAFPADDVLWATKGRSGILHELGTGARGRPEVVI